MNCEACDADYYCPYWGTHSTKAWQNDDDGNCCDETTSSGCTPCQLTCKDGYLCMGGATHYNNLDNVTVKLCPAGNVCSVDETLTTPDDTQRPCNPGSYQASEGQIACDVCPAGFFCEESAMTAPEPCPIGYYCDVTSRDVNVDCTDTAGDGTDVYTCKTPCPEGTYNNIAYASAVEQCMPCPAGKYCEVGTIEYSGFCDEGHICISGAYTVDPSESIDGVPAAGTTGTGFVFSDGYVATNNGLCPAGHYCPRGSTFPAPCDAGTYQDEIGYVNASGLSVCKECPEYRYCPDNGMTTNGNVCYDGYVCFGSSVYAQPFDYQMGRLCNAGNQCTAGMETQCADGKFAPVDGMSECTTCPPGFYCNASTGTITPVICPTYHYCPAGSADATACDPGTYTESHMKGLEFAEQCAPCPTGYYCPEGAYESSNKCAAGYYCHSGASIANDSDNICPGGYYCPEGTAVPIHCADGFYSVPGAKSASDCVECYAGYYCVREVNLATMWECPPGHYCEEGNEEPKECPKGTYNFWPKGETVDDCEECPRGTNCDQTGIALHENHQCPPGYYCEENSYSP